MNESLSLLHDRLFNEAERVAESIIADLSGLTDDCLLETRRRAKDLGAVAWRIECACDAEVVARSEKRGNKRAVIEQAAKESGVSVQTVYKNAQISDVVDIYCESRDVTTFPSSADKSLVVESLRAPDPVEALGKLIGLKEAAAEVGATFTARDARREVSAMKIKRTETPLPSGKFAVILADPPWRYEFSETDSRQIENQYPTMTLEEICALNVPEIAADDSVLFLWTTSPKLEESFSVIAAWGFRYVTSMVWDKEHIGMGYYFRQQHELLLVAKRGALPVPDPSLRPSSVLRSARTVHSRKPEDLYSRLEEMYPNHSRVELFCRTPRTGWSVWGNEIDS